MQVLEGTKLKMSQVFMEDGQFVPVTLVKTVGGELNVELENKDVVVSGVSKGKGFTGVMKKWGFSGQQKTRGQSDRARHAGSIGSQTPGRVLPGKKMAGRHGNQQVTIKGLKIIKVDTERGEVMVSGPIPGARNSKISIKVLEGQKEGREEDQK